MQTGKQEPPKAGTNPPSWSNWSHRQKINSIRAAAVEAEKRYGTPVLLKQILKIWNDQNPECNKLLDLNIIMSALNIKEAPRPRHPPGNNRPPTPQNRSTTNNKQPKH